MRNIRSSTPANKGCQKFAMFDSLLEMKEYSDSHVKAYLQTLDSLHDNGEKHIIESGEYDACWRAIFEGDPKQAKAAMETAYKLRDMALELEPSLALQTDWIATENSEIWDSGAVAAGEPRPCLVKGKKLEAKPGKGDGAYRIIINTDVPWWCSPTQGAAAMTALVMILANQAPVEIWVQQGWLGSCPQDGITLVPVFNGTLIEPSSILFWTAHEWKDSPFSFIMNRILGRRSGICAIQPELECDLWLAGFTEENQKKSDEAAMQATLVQWVKEKATQVFFGATNLLEPD